MYKLPVKLDGIERRKRSTGVLHIVAGLFLLLKSADYFLKTRSFVVIFFLLAAVLSVVYGILKKRIDGGAQYNRWVRLVQVLTFTLLSFQFAALRDTLSTVSLFAWAIGCLFLMFTERKVFHDAEMLFTKEGIFIPGYFSNRRLFWPQISDVVVRPDFVTIFHTNESFLQYEVLKKLPATALDEIALYCREQIESEVKSGN